MGKTRYLVVERNVNRMNRKDVEDFQYLLKNVATLKTPGKKKLFRLQRRLLEQGVIVPYTRDQARAAMIETYKSFPWWKKASLRIRFHGKETVKRIKRKWALVKLWWVTR